MLSKVKEKLLFNKRRRDVVKPIDNLYPGDNAASPGVEEVNSVGAWVSNGANVAVADAVVTAPKDGAYCIEARHEGSGVFTSIVHEVIPVVIGNTYNISIWVKKGAGLTSNPQIRILNVDGNSNGVDVIWSSWQRFQWSLICNATGTMRIEVFSTQNAIENPNSVYVDGIIVREYD